MHCDVVSLNMLILEICNCPQLDGVLFSLLKGEGGGGSG